MKLKIIIFILIILYSSVSFADTIPECKIKSGPSIELSKYINNLNIALSGIRNATLKSKCTSGTGIINNPFNQSSNLIIKSTNDLVDFTSFMNGFKILKFLYDGTIPDPIYRDYSILKSLDERINYYVDFVSQKCALDSKIKSDDVEYFLSEYGNVNYSNLSSSKIFEAIKSINHKVFSDYTSIAIGEQDSINSNVDGILMKELIADLKNSYSPTQILGCKQVYGEEILKKLQKFSDIGSGISKGVGVWKEAFKLLYGVMGSGDMKYYESQEKNILESGLRKMGLKEEDIIKMSGNLADFNKCGTNLLCHAENIGGKIKSSVEAFGGFFVTMNDNMVKNAKSTQNYKDNTAEIQIQKQIQQELIINKENLKNIMETQDKILANNMYTLVELHFNLKKINKQLTNESIKAAQDLCNSQAKGIGNCGAGIFK